MKCLHSTISGSSIIYLSLQIRAKSIRKSFENRTSKGTEEKNSRSSLFLLHIRKLASTPLQPDQSRFRISQKFRWGVKMTLNCNDAEGYTIKATMSGMLFTESSAAQAMLTKFCL